MAAGDGSASGSVALGAWVNATIEFRDRIASAFQQLNSAVKRQIAAIGDKFGNGVRRAKMHHIYYVLATFDMLAVAGGLYLSHRITQLYGESVQINSVWAGHIRDLSILAGHAQETNAPGNDVFDTRDVPAERLKLKAALSTFMAKLGAVDHAVMASAEATDEANADLLPSVRRIAVSMVEMVDEAELIFQAFERGEPDKAGERMATMDRKYASVTKAIGEAIGAMQSIQGLQFDVQTKQANALRLFEYLIGALMVLMVSAVVYFGHRISLAMKKADDDRQVAADQLQVLNGELTELNATLEARVQERTRQLEEAQAENVRKGKLAQLGQLTATVAHEIRNPLGSVKTAAHLIERKIKGTELDIDKPLLRVKAGINRCDAIITELLDFARSKQLMRKTVDLDAWLAKVVEEQGKSLPDTVRVSLDSGLAARSVSFDADRMGRVVINLLSNAAEAMVGKEGHKIADPTADPSITVSTRLAGSNIEIVVKDNGPGISEENIKRILEPLFTTKSFGVGLGLPAIEQILDQHGGGLRIESKLGEGATFTAWFPLAAEQAPAAQGEGNSPSLQPA